MESAVAKWSVARPVGSCEVHLLAASVRPKRRYLCHYYADLRLIGGPVANFYRPLNQLGAGVFL